MYGVRLLSFILLKLRETFFLPFFLLPFPFFLSFSPFFSFLFFKRPLPPTTKQIANLKAVSLVVGK